LTELHKADDARGPEKFKPSFVSAGTAPGLTALELGGDPRLTIVIVILLLLSPDWIDQDYDQE